MISAGGRVPYVDNPCCLHPINPPQSHKAAASSANTSDGFSSWITAGLGLYEGLVVWCKTKCACKVLISQFGEQLQNPNSQCLWAEFHQPLCLVWINSMWRHFFFFMDHILLRPSGREQVVLARFPPRPTPHHCPRATRLPSMLTCCGILPAAHIWMPFPHHCLAKQMSRS